MANRRRSTRRRRRAPIRRPVRRPAPAAGTTSQRTPATDTHAQVAARNPRVPSLPSLPHLRRDLMLSAALGVGLTLVVIVVSAVTG